MKIFITGDSHIGALKKGWIGLETKSEIPKNLRFSFSPLGPGDSMLTPFFEKRSDHLKITSDDGAKWLTRIPEESSEQENILYVISAPLHLQPIILHPFFKRHRPSEISNSPTKSSKALIRRIARERKRYAIEFVIALKSLNQKVAVIEPPRTFKHHPNIKKTSLDIITYLEDFCRNEVKQLLTRNGIPTIELPVESYDDDGLMLDNYRHESSEDRHHGNQAYGEMMIKQVIDFANKLQ